MQLVGRPGVQRYSRAACLRRCHVRCVEKESAGGKAQRLRQRRWQLGDSYDTRQSSHVQGDDDLPRLNSMQLRRSQSGAQAARLADNLIQAPLEPRGVVANLLDKLRVCTSLAKSTYAHLGTGWLWLACFLRLMVFSTILAPGFFLLTVFYFFSNRVHRNLWYGQKPRNLLDIYVPYRHWFNNGPVPVVIFITGGAYIIGYKAWGALLAKRLSQAGVLVVCLDYRNFPQGIITDMMEDCQAGIGWVLRNIEGFGGDPSRVYVMGQSCGGHLAALTLQKQHELWGSGEIKAANRRGLSDSSWNPDSIKGFLALSSLFNMSTMQAQFERRGMNKGMVLAIFGQSSQQPKPVSFSQFSPYQHFSEEIPRKKMPRTLLMHGTADATVPCSESEHFKQALMKHGIDVQLKLYEGATHTSKLLEDPMRGGKDDVVADVLEFMKLDTTEHTRFWPMLPFPRLTSAVASFVCPF